MTRIGAQIIFGANPEPFLEAALESVSWVDYYCAINTAPEDGIAAQNEAIFRRTVPREKQRLERINFVQPREGAEPTDKTFSFAKARNAALDLADPGDFVLLVDSDDVHYPEMEGLAKVYINKGHDIITAHFWHLVGYKDLWRSEPHREILFKNENTRFEKGVHEQHIHPRANPALLPGYHYVHYGYIKPPREIFRRWKFYSDLDGDFHHYDGRDPDNTLDGWFEECQPFWRSHPLVARKTLEMYPEAPRSVRALSSGEITRNIGLVLLTWNDSENLRVALQSLATTRQPFELCLVDNGSSDDCVKQVVAFADKHEVPLHTIINQDGASLAVSLNQGFGYFMDQESVDYIGWIHPDMIFERDTWLECLRHAMDTHPDIAKVGACDMNVAIPEEPIPANTQCYIVRKTALHDVGLFNERFLACGGFEDWEHNVRLLKAGRVMAWPSALIRHNSMGTRTHHDNSEAGRRNAEIYYELVGQWDPMV
jgi:glycosyltransferase involved in cell wall biosynthesis